MATLIKGSKLLDGKGAALNNAAVLVEEGRIVAVGSQYELALQPGVDIIDGIGKTIMPGLVDAHVHLVNTGETFSARDARTTTDEEMMILAVKNAQLAIKSGITSVRDLGGKGFLTVSVRDAIDRGVIPGPTIVSCGAALTITGGQSYYKAMVADTADEMKKAARHLIHGGADCVKIFGSGGNATPGSNPLASQYSLEEFRAATDEAHRLGKHVAAHVHPTTAIRLALEAGVDCLEHCTWLRPGGLGIDEPLMEEIVSRGIYVSLGLPSTWYRVPLDEIQDVMDKEGREELLGPRYESIQRMFESGAKVVSSSDAGSTATRIDELGLLLEFLVNQLGIPVQTVIMSATSLAAEAIGLGRETGSLEVGKKADIILVDDDPTTDITALQRVDIVMKDGIVVAGGGNVFF